MKPSIDIGISESDRKKITDDLACLLADTYAIYVKTHSFHWNVTGPLFPTLHALFEKQYLELAPALDEIAERIRSLGYPVPATFSEFLKRSSIPETPGVPPPDAMVRYLLDGHEACVRTARRAIGLVEDTGDQPSLDLITRRMEFHEKQAWMLRSMLEFPAKAKAA
jgi:starvation-inducible DNA-binding protein